MQLQQIVGKVTCGDQSYWEIRFDSRAFTYKVIVTNDTLRNSLPEHRIEELDRVDIPVREKRGLYLPDERARDFWNLKTYYTRDTAQRTRAEEKAAQELAEEEAAEAMRALEGECYQENIYGDVFYDTDED